ncbi:MAG: gp436 family protein [Gemmobacter sp.]
MTYATEAQLIERYGEPMLTAATDRGPVPTGAPDPASLARALASADAVIDGYLAARYALPLAEVPPLLADLAQAIAIWRLHPYATDPKLKEDFESAMRTLRDIADGRVRLALAGAEVPGTGGTGARITDRERPFTEGNMKGFI